MNSNRRYSVSFAIAGLAVFSFCWTTVRTISQDKQPAAKELPLGRGIRCVTFSHDGALLAAGLGEPKQRGRVVLWDVAGRKPLWSHEEGDGVPRYRPLHVMVAEHTLNAESWSATPSPLE